jgi:hypothetical protein
MEETNTFLDETIHIMPEDVMRLQGHQNKVVPLVKSSIHVDLSNGTKFHNYTC